jgi:hypothetical protein
MAVLGKKAMLPRTGRLHQYAAPRGMADFIATVNEFYIVAARPRDYDRPRDET